MPKTSITMVVFNSFPEIIEALAGHGIKVNVPKEPIKPGIHVVTLFDDGDLSCMQHVCVVVVGDYKNVWELCDTYRGRSALGSDCEIISVKFENGQIPLLIDGENFSGELNSPSLYGPRWMCIRIGQ